MTQEPSAARSVAVAATVRTTMHSRQGPCQNRWSQAHRALGPGVLGLAAQIRQLGERIAIRAVSVARASAQAGTVSWTNVGRMSPTAPRGSDGRTGATPHGTPGSSGLAAIGIDLSGEPFGRVAGR